LRGLVGARQTADVGKKPRRKMEEGGQTDGRTDEAFTK